MFALSRRAVLGALSAAALPFALPRRGREGDVARALADSARPLAGPEPAGPLDDLRPLGAAIGNLPVVGLGEVVHGSHELYTLKHRVFRYLVAERGFTTFALEASWSAGLRLDAYVRTGAGDPRRIMAEEFGRGQAPWHVREYLDLVRWMRDHNARQPRRRLRFLGTDLSVPRLGDALFRDVMNHVGRSTRSCAPSSRGTTARRAPTPRRPTSRRCRPPTATVSPASPPGPSSGSASWRRRLPTGSAAPGRRSRRGTSRRRPRCWRSTSATRTGTGRPCAAGTR